MGTYLIGVAKKVTEYQAELTKTVNAIPTVSIDPEEESIRASDITEVTAQSANPEVINETSDQKKITESEQQLDLGDHFFEPTSTEIESTQTQNTTTEPRTPLIPPNDIDHVGAFSSFSDSSIREIVKLLSYSLLSGEFLTIDEVDDELNSLIKQIQLLVTIVEASENLSEEWRVFRDSIVYCLEEYQKFVSYLVANFTKYRSDHYFIIEDNNIDQIPHLSDELQNVIRMFTLTLKVSRKDLLINSDRSELQSLIILKRQVDSLKGTQKSVAYALDVKLEFLIHKWGERYKSKNKNKTIAIKYRIGDTEKSIDKFEIKIPTLINWDKRIYHHYDFCTDANQYGYYIHDTLNKKRKGYDKLNFTELHGLIKYYKDFKKSDTELEQIVDYLIHEDYSDRHSYDQYCIDIFRNYAINNYFSLISENETWGLDIYREKYLECKRKLNHLSDNYFLEKKYLDYVLKRIETDFAKSSKEEKISVHEKYVDKVDKECTKLLNEYYDKKEWAKTHDNYIVILPYEESLVELSKEKHPDLPKILFFTSFVLPYYKDSIDYEYSKTRQLFREVKALTSVVGSLKTDLQNLNELKKDFDKKDLKSIETITLFTAVITFVLSSIPAFKFVETVQHAALFMLSMSASLAIFILLVFSLTRGFSKFFKKHRNVITAAVIVFILIVTTFSLISFENKSVDGIINKSIQNQKERAELDSLKNILNPKLTGEKISTVK
ncbi:MULTISPECIES: hypothetical protein [Sphingobacterium]|uniref:hypothetical protein n=1 Tax=Sphingobacterium TaxID=28453 RepID=UPI0013D9E4A3|nr:MULTISPECIES: hypothetical protein [unclassified Sphingobacterium]